MSGVVFPSWWPAYPDVRVGWTIEFMMIMRFQDMIEGCKVLHWMPTDVETQQVLFEDSEAYLRVYRTGGEVDLDNNVNLHRVQFAAISADRDTSWRIIEFVQQVLYAYERSGYVLMQDGKLALMTFLGETLGPILDPQQIRDERLVSFTAELETPWVKGLQRIITENVTI